MRSSSATLRLSGGSHLISTNTMKALLMLLMCTHFTHSGATAPTGDFYASTSMTSFSKISETVPPGSAPEDNCETFLLDGSDLCFTWSISTGSNFLSWYVNGTRYHNNCLMVPGAFCGMVPDYKLNTTASRGGLLTERKVVTRAMADKLLCVDADCSDLRDVRNGADFCQLDYCITYPDPYITAPLVEPKPLTLDNIIKDTNLLVGRQVVSKRLLNTSSNGGFKNELTNPRPHNEFIKLPDTLFGAIFSALYQNYLQPVIRYQHVKNSCVLVIVPSSETCTPLLLYQNHSILENNGSTGSNVLPINDTCGVEERINETWLALDHARMKRLYIQDEANVKNFTVDRLYHNLQNKHSYSKHYNITKHGVSELILSCIDDTKYNSNCSLMSSATFMNVVHINGRNWVYYNISSGGETTAVGNQPFVNFKYMNFNALFESLSSPAGLVAACSVNNTLGTDLSLEVERWVSILFPYLLKDLTSGIGVYNDQTEALVNSHPGLCDNVLEQYHSDDIRIIAARLDEFETNTVSNLTPISTVAGAITNMLSTLLALAAITYAIPKQIVTSLVAFMSITLAMTIILINEREARSDNSKALFAGLVVISHEIRSCQNASIKYITFVDQSSPENGAVYVILGIALAMCICVTAVNISRLLNAIYRRRYVIPHV